MTHVHLI